MLTPLGGTRNQNNAGIANFDRSMALLFIASLAYMAGTGDKRQSMLGSPSAGAGGWLAINAVQPGKKLCHTFPRSRRCHHLHCFRWQIVTKVSCGRWEERKNERKT